MVATPVHATHGSLLPDPSSPAPPTMEMAADLQRAYQYFNDQLFEGLLPPCLITLHRERASYGYFMRDQFVRHDGKAFTHQIAINPAYFVTREIRHTLSTLVREMVNLWQAVFGRYKTRAGYHNKEWARRMESVGLIPSSTGEPGGRDVGYRVSHYIEEDGHFDRAVQRLLEEDHFMIHWLDRYPLTIPLGMTIPRGYRPPGDDVMTSPATEAATRPTSLLEPMTFDGSVLSAAGHDALTSIAMGDQPDPRDLPEERFRATVSLVNWPSDQSSGGTRTKYVCPECYMRVWGKAELNIVCGDCKKPLQPSKASQGYSGRPRRESDGSAISPKRARCKTT